MMEMGKRPTQSMNYMPRLWSPMDGQVGRRGVAWAGNAPLTGSGLPLDNTSARLLQWANGT